MKTALTKSDELNNTFINFIRSLALTLHKVTNILSYAFVIPILPMLYQIALNGSISKDDVTEIVKRVISFGIITVSGIVLKELIIKILRRFGKGKFGEEPKQKDKSETKKN